MYWTVDNGTREGLDKFLKAASSEPETVLHYEFMQDYKVCSYSPVGNFGGSVKQWNEQLQPVIV